MGRKLTILTIKQKIEILDDIKLKKKSKKELSKIFCCDVSTINRILRNEEKIRSLGIQNKNMRRKRLREGKHKDVERAVTKWFDQARTSNASISGPILLEKAKQFAVKLKSDFQLNSGWLHRWKKRENITSKTIHGEENDSNHQGAKDYVNNVLPQILQGYEPENIFNADETGLFYKALPTKTLARTNTAIKGGKTQKARLTLLFLCNSTGSYKKAFVIGKPKNPRCFKNKIMPVPYYYQNKAWTTGQLWSTILKNLDDEMRAKKKKILLFVDNAACHKTDTVLTNVKLNFLPPNTTPIIQPLDLGIIHCFKAYYRQIILRKQLIAIERGLTQQEFVKSISLLDAMNFIKRAFWLVKPESISKCFNKGGFISSEGGNYEEDVVEVPMDADEFDIYVSCDANVECYGLHTDEEIVEQVEQECQDQEPESSDDNIYNDNDNNNVQAHLPTFKEIVIALEMLRTYLNIKNMEAEELDSLEEKIFGVVFKNNMIQKRITDFV